LVVLVIGATLINRHIFALPYWRVLWRPIMASLVMAASMLLYRSVWLVPVYMLVYVVALYALRGITEQDREMLRAALPQRRSGAVAR